MKSTNVSFCNTGGHRLAGILDIPDQPVRGYILFAHCFTCGKNLRTARNICESLTDAGFAVLRFDFTGLGQSEGEFADSNFSSNVSDLIAASQFLADEYRAPSVLIGHSLGGTAVLRAAAAIPSAVAVATIGSPAEPTHVSHLFNAALPELNEKGVAEVDIGGRPFRVKQQFLHDLEQHDLPTDVAKLRKALLVMHAPLDDVVEVEQASKLFNAAKHPKSFVSLDRADHLLSDEADSRYAGRVLASWVSRYLTDAAPAATPTEGVTATTWADGFYTTLNVDDHHWVADEPKAVGGTGLGPSPYDLLSAALASCTTMTLKMYAGFKGLPLESVQVNVRHQKVHAKDCDDCESSTGKIDEFSRELSVQGDLTDAQKQRLLAIADRCPVHQTLEGGAKVRTRLTD